MSWRIGSRRGSFFTTVVVIIAIIGILVPCLSALRISSLHEVPDIANMMEMQSLAYSQKHRISNMSIDDLETFVSSLGTSREENKKIGNYTVRTIFDEKTGLSGNTCGSGTPSVTQFCRGAHIVVSSDSGKAVSLFTTKKSTEEGGLSFPKGTILQVSATASEILERTGGSWKLCDGTNDTPDLRDAFIVGEGSSVGSVGTTVAGVDEVTITVARMASHTHYGNTGNSPRCGGCSDWSLSSGYPGSYTTGPAGEANPEPIKVEPPPYYAVYYVMRK